MALDNLISVQFTAQELATIDSALEAIEKVMAGKAVNLTPKQRQQYGRVAYEMEVWVDKCYDYMRQTPHLVPAFINMTEHEADLTAHRALNPRIERINMVTQAMKDTNLLLGTDIYNTSLTFYRAAREAAKTNAPGASPVYTDLQRQYPGGGKSTQKSE